MRRVLTGKILSTKRTRNLIVIATKRIRNSTAITSGGYSKPRVKDTKKEQRPIK
jgi:hypothetical protein